MKTRMMLTLATELTLLLGVAGVPAQDKKGDDDPTVPGPEHKIFEQLVGSYDCKVRAWLEPGKPPEESAGSLKRKLLFGGRYLQEEYDGKLGPDNFSGMGLVAFDRVRKKYVLTWIDSLSTGFMISEGTYDA